MTKDEQVTLTELFHRLYGQNGYEGDVPRIIKHIEKHTEHFEDHSRRLLTLEVERETEKKASASKIKTTGKYAGIISAVVYVIYSLGAMAGWFPPIGS